ncbi:WD40 repeat domain-containing protein, partial [Streptomyces sp. ISL-98]
MTSTIPAEDRALRAWALAQARSVGRGGAGPEPPAAVGGPSQELTAGITRLEGLEAEYVTCMDIGAVPGGPLLVATGSVTGRVRVWDGQTGKLLRSMQDGYQDVLSVTWNMAGGRALLAVQSYLGGAIWDGMTAALLVRVPGALSHAPVRVRGAERFLFRRPYGGAECVIDVYGPGGYYGDLRSAAESARPVLCGLADSSGTTTVVSSDRGIFKILRATETPHSGRTTTSARLAVDADRPTLMAATGLSRDHFLLAEGFENGFSVWEVVANTGHRVASRLHRRGVKTLDWLDMPDHRTLLAIGCDDGSLMLVGLEGPSAQVGAPGRWQTEIFDSPFDHPAIMSVTWCLPSSRQPMTAVLCEDFTVRREPGPFAAVPQEASGNKLSSGPDTPPRPDATPPPNAPPPSDAPPPP